MSPAPNVAEEKSHKGEADWDFLEPGGGE